MRKRVAAKVIYRAQEEGGPDYREGTLDRAVDKLWRSNGKRWHVSGCRRRLNQEGRNSAPMTAA